MATISGLAVAIAMTISVFGYLRSRGVDAAIAKLKELEEKEMKLLRQLWDHGHETPADLPNARRDWAPEMLAVEKLSKAEFERLKAEEHWG